MNGNELLAAILGGGIMSICLLACGQKNGTPYAERTEWRVSSGECRLPGEREKAAELAKSFLSNTAKSLAGDDQDYEDTIKAALREARDLTCENIIIEVDRNGSETGRWKQLPAAIPRSDSASSSPPIPKG